MDMDALKKRLKKVCQALKVISKENLDLAADELTANFCLEQLQHFANYDLLVLKAEKELGLAPFKPLGRLLIIVSEKDILGSLFAFLGAYITGNEIVIKARNCYDLLMRVEETLKSGALILDWLGGEQDDEKLLTGINAILLAGSDSLITHFRKVSPPQIRLIEFGPKLSAIALGQEIIKKDLSVLINNLIFETSLFKQSVCSSPRFILLEDRVTAEIIFKKLSFLLNSLVDLDLETKLLQKGRALEFSLLKKAEPDFSLENWQFSPQSGWGITLSNELDPSLWFDKGFNLVFGEVEKNLQKARKLWPASLQNLALDGFNDLPTGDGFTRLCSLGLIHKRSLLSPHDGFFELSALVSFISKEMI